MLALATNPRSPKDLAVEFGEPLPRLASQVRVLHTEYGLLTEVDQEQIRGSVKHIYGLRSIEDIQSELAAHPECSERRAEIFLLDYLASVLRGIMAKGPDVPDKRSAVAGGPMVIDGPGWEGAVEVIQDANKQLRAIAEESEERIRAGGSSPVPIKSTLALLDLHSTSEGTTVQPSSN